MVGVTSDQSCSQSHFFAWVLMLEYEGSPFHGWQRQTPTDTYSIQALLEQALSSIANEPIHTVCAGRTDKGVHACRQYVHFQTTSARSEVAWVLGTNTLLPKVIRVRAARPIDARFNARRSAAWRRYRYVLVQQKTVPAHMHRLVTWLHRPLAIEPMQQAAQSLLGEHDFSAFRSVDCQSRSAVRHLMHFEIYQKGKFLIFDVQANAFLQHMVRNMVGSLLVIGLGKQPPVWLSSVLASKDRTKAGPTAPPQGLYLVEVHYPEYPDLFPNEAVGPDFLV